MVPNLEEAKPNQFPGLPRRRLSRDDVLALIRDVWRLPRKIDADADLILEIRPDMTIAEFRRMIGRHTQTFDWRDMARWFEGFTGASCGTNAWSSVLLPESKRTLGGVLDLLAEHAVGPAMPRERDGQPLPWVERAFESLKSALRDRGANVDDLTLSQRLNPIIDRAPIVFQYDLIRLAPGRLPPLRTRHRFIILIGILIALVAISMIMQIQPWFAWPIRIEPYWFFVFYPIMFALSHPKLRPHDYKLGELITVEDLCYLLVSPPPHGDDDVIDP